MVEKRDETYIDPQFFLPPNVYDIRYVENDNVSEDEDTATEFVDSESVNPDPVEDASEDETWSPATPESHNELPIPDGLVVVSQTVKAAAGGGYLVDIVIDIPDLPGVENFDVAVTKA
jgi:hypothetical protein